MESLPFLHRQYMKCIITTFLNVCTMVFPAIAQKNISKATATIAAEIAKNNKYESQFTGFAGTPSPQYTRYQNLQKTASREELVELLKHNNPVVRVYSFKALYETDRKLAARYSAGLLNDTIGFITLQGCIAGKDNVKSFVVRMLRNAD